MKPIVPRLGTTGFRRCAMSTTPTLTPERTQAREQLREPYPHCRVIVLNDDFNTFQHVVDCLVRHIPGMVPDRAWELAHRIDGQGSAEVWSGPQEQAEHYHQLLSAEGLTMAPLERS
ncbi:ATP-dependent Clp protease adapter protein ClpS [Cyanobium sp.]|nr:ATP-dependent Clp protease adapter protein ClpS [Cyanobium sp.]